MAMLPSQFIWLSEFLTQSSVVVSIHVGIPKEGPGWRGTPATQGRNEDATEGAKATGGRRN